MGKKTKLKKIKRKKTLKRMKTFKRNKSQKGGSEDRRDKRRRVEPEILIFTNDYNSRCHIDSDDLPHKYTERRMVRGGWGIPFISALVSQDFIVDPLDDETLRNIRDYNIINCKIHKVRLSDDDPTVAQEMMKLEIAPSPEHRDTYVYDDWNPDNKLVTRQRLPNPFPEQPRSPLNYIFAIPYNEPNKLYYFDKDIESTCYPVSRDDDSYHGNYNSSDEYSRQYQDPTDHRNDVTPIPHDRPVPKYVTHECLVKTRDVIIAGTIIKIEIEGRDIFIVINNSGHYTPKWNAHSIDLINNFFHNVKDRLVIVELVKISRTNTYNYLQGEDLLDNTKVDVFGTTYKDNIESQIN